MRAFLAWLHVAALSLGGPGLFAVAFLDSSFLSLPQINDVLVVLMVTEHKAWVAYYAAMATAGSVAGCYVIYRLAARGGQAFLRRRFSEAQLQRAFGLFERHGALTLVIPALLPPPAPFKVFVLAAGVARVTPVQFILAITIARGFRYGVLGVLAVAYGDQALELMRTHGRMVALVLVGSIVLTLGVWWFVQRRSRVPEPSGGL